MPNKLLLDKTGHHLLWHTIQRALESKLAELIIIATPDPEIYDAVISYKLNKVMPYMTGHFDSGTDRIVGLIQIMKACGHHCLDDSDIIVNLQGDEPELPGIYIDKLTERLTNDTNCDVYTIATPITIKESQSPEIVKVVLTHDKQAMYFSRTPIPYNSYSLKHLGIYAYRVKFLNSIKNMSITSLYTEKLEQLRWLQCGCCIRVLVDDVDIIDINTESDYQKFVTKQIKL